MYKEVIKVLLGYTKEVKMDRSGTKDVYLGVHLLAKHTTTSHVREDLHFRYLLVTASPAYPMNEILMRINEVVQPYVRNINTPCLDHVCFLRTSGPRLSIHVFGLRIFFKEI